MTRLCRCYGLIGLLVVLAISDNVYAATYCEISGIPSSEIVYRIASQHDSGASSTCKNQQKTTFYTKSLASNSSLIVCNSEMQTQFGGVPPGWVATEHYDKDNTKASDCYWVGSTSITKHSADRIEKVSSFASSSSYKNICTLGNNVGFNENDLAAVGWIVSDEIPTGSYCGDTYQKRRIKKAASGETMCATYGAVPYGFTVSRIVKNDTDCTSALFSSATKYVLDVIPATGTTSTCVLPKNYNEYAYTLKTSSTLTCAGGAQYTIGRAFDGGFSCAVPSGWGASAKVPETNTSLDCASNFVYQLSALKDGLITCYLEGNKAPAGYVVSAYNSSITACGNGAGYTLRTPKDGIYMCDAYSSIPTGFWYGAAGAKNGCSSGFDLATLPSNGRLSTCGEPPAAPPDGYVYASVSDFSSCPSGKKQYTIGVAGNPQAICYVSSQFGPLPQGYMISSDRAGANCAAGVPSTIRIATDGMQVCSTENMPAGFGIGSVTNNSTTDCSDYALVLEKLDGEGPYSVCSTNQIPSGYVITSVDYNATDCGGMAFLIRKPVLSGGGGKIQLPSVSVPAHFNGWSASRYGCSQYLYQ